jgi:hypothetical protein
MRNLQYKKRSCHVAYVVSRCEQMVGLLPCECNGAKIVRGLCTEYLIAAIL